MSQMPVQQWLKQRGSLGKILSILIIIGALAVPFLYQYPAVEKFFNGFNRETISNVVLIIMAAAAWLFFDHCGKDIKIWLSQIRKHIETHEWQKAQNSFWEKPLFACTLSAAILIFCFLLSEGTRTLIFLAGGLIGWHFLHRRTKAAEQGVTTERLTRAIEYLLNDKPSILLGGVLFLEQITESQPEEREKITRILAARIRELAPAEYKSPFPDRAERLHIEIAIQALSRIVAKEIPSQESKYSLCDLRKVDCRGLFIMEHNFSDFNFMGADFRNTYLVEANFTDTHLADVQMIRSDLSGANLNKANLNGANLSDADLSGADLSDANLSGANLSGANLSGANLSGTDFDGVTTLTQPQIKQAFCWKDNLPLNLLPSLLSVLDKKT